MLKPNIQSLVRKAGIKTFFKEKGHMPSQHSRIKFERYLGIDLRNYTSPSCDSYDKNFTKWYLSEYEPQVHDSDANRVEIKKFFNKTGRLPGNRANASKRERILSKRMYSYIAKSRNVYDPTFSKWIAEIRNRK